MTPILLLLLLLLPFLPRPRAPRMEAWRGTAFAHRGLHGGGIPENTLSAFRRAAEAGLGIELDVRLSRDGCPMVFHDDTLKRMAGRGEAPEALTRAELQALKLPGGERIPTLEEALDAAGRAPLLIELKHGPKDAALCRAVAERLAARGGRVLLESFRPAILRRMRRLAPGCPRGLLLPRQVCGVLARLGPAGAALQEGLVPWLLCRPDFIAAAMPPGRVPRPGRRVRALWTIRNEADCAECLVRGHLPIFEGFTPGADSPADAALAAYGLTFPPRHGTIPPEMDEE